MTTIPDIWLFYGIWFAFTLQVFYDGIGDHVKNKDKKFVYGLLLSGIFGFVTLVVYLL